MPDVELKLPVNALISFHYFANRDVAEMQSWGLRLIGDSGAYSSLSQGAQIDLGEFAEWGLRWRDNLAWLASLDVIGDQEASFKNYKKLRARGLDVIPTIHYGCDPSELDKYAAEGVDFVGLGGMVGRKSEVQRLLRWTLQVFRYARDKHPNMRFHGWGITHSQLLMNLPWYSVDSSGFSSCYRFARLSVFDPHNAKNVGIDLNGRDIYKHTDLLRNVYGVEPSEIAVSTRETRRQLVRTAIASVQKQEEFLRKRFDVSTPTYGVMIDAPAPQIHVASAAPLYMQEVAGIDLSPTRGPNIHAASSVDWPFKLATKAAPNVHVALGFPGAQSTISVNEFDKAPDIISKEGKK